MRSHWTDQVPWLASRGAVLDVGSGPAVLARMLWAEHAAALSSVRWICLDEARWPLAPPDGWPPGLHLRQGENFARAVPPPGGVGAVLSNFGLEYVPRQSVARACWNWMSPGAALHAALHQRDSVIDRAATSHLSDIRFALEEVKLFECASAMLAALATAPVDPMERMMHAVEVRDAYNLGVNALKARMEKAGQRSAPLMDMLHGVTALVGEVRQGRLDSALQALSQRGAAYGAECRRLEAMRDAALDDREAQRFVEDLARTGLAEVRVHPLACPLGPVAWVVTGRKP